MNFCPSSSFSNSSCASLLVVIMAPSATSMISVKPISLKAPYTCSIDVLNCPRIDGAMMATIFSPFLIRCNTSNVCEISKIAPNGQAWIHCPHWIHLFSSISQMPFSSIVIALAGQIFLHGLMRSAIALYGQALAHMPHSLHLSGSM